MKIVIVSSDPFSVEQLETLLDSTKFQLESIQPTAEGIARTRMGKPDLYLVDEAGLDQDVLLVCEKIRQYTVMPIMVLSMAQNPGKVEQVLNAGADECLLKPISRSVLMAHLNTLARRARAEKDAALSIVRGENEKFGQLGLLVN